MAGTNSRDVYSWDANVFLAHLKQEPDKPLADIAAVADEIEKGAADLVVSTIVIAEMLDVIDDPALAVDFNEFLRRPNVEIVNVTPRIARRTAEMRAAWRSAKQHEKENRNIKTPDAIIMATAALYGVTALHTFEPGLQRHSKTELVSRIEICQPILAGKQKVLDLKVEDVNEATESIPAKTNSAKPETQPVTTDAGASPESGDEHQAIPISVISDKASNEIELPPKVQDAVKELPEAATEIPPNPTTTTVVAIEGKLPIPADTIAESLPPPSGGVEDQTSTTQKADVPPPESVKPEAAVSLKSDDSPALPSA